MWTRLMYLHLNQAFKPIKEGKFWKGSMLSGRYKHLLVKEFRKVDLPTFMVDSPKNKKKIRDEIPTDKKAQAEAKLLRIEKIKQNLIKSDEEILKYRREKINKRRMKGLDRAMSEMIPEFMELSRENQGLSSTSESTINVQVENDRSKEEIEPTR